jgi:hypothetical protein
MKDRRSEGVERETAQTFKERMLDEEPWEEGEKMPTTCG